MLDPRRKFGTSLLLGVVVVALAMLSLSAAYPVFFVLSASLKSDDDYNTNAAGLPREFDLGAIGSAWDALHGYLFNTFIVVGASVAVLLVIAFLASYALTHLRLPGAPRFLAAIVSLMIIPAAVLMIPEFRIVLSFGLLNDRVGLILVYTAIQLPFSIFLMSTYMRSIPAQLVEAARVDGAGSMRILRSIIAPLVGPAAATLLTLNFLVLWNELLFSLVILQRDEERTIMPGIITQQGQFLTSVPTVAAGLLFSMIPPLIVFILFQRDLVRGLTAGAVK